MTDHSPPPAVKIPPRQQGGPTDNGLLKDLAKWDASAIPPTADELANYVFGDEIIEWNRLGSFQDVTLKLIAGSNAMNGLVASPEYRVPFDLPVATLTWLACSKSTS